MEEKEILEGNILIANFIKAKISKSKLGTVAPAGFDILFKYHSSWDSLMPVIEKISKENNFVLSSVGMWACYINRKDSDDMSDSICDRGGFEPLIMNVWHCVVDYIKWREKQRKYK